MRYTEMDMDRSSPVFLGVDLLPGNRPFLYAALDINRRILTLSQGSLQDVQSYIAGMENVLAVINSPSRLNQGLMRQPAVRKNLLPVPAGEWWQNLRVVEYELILRGIHANRTPSVLSDCPKWMRYGFELYDLLQDLGFLAYPALGITNIRMETNAEAGYWALLGHRPYEARSLEGRIQRQLVLFEHEIPVTDPIEFFEEITRHRLLQGILPLQSILNQHELDALMSAYIGWLAGRQPEQIQSIGDPQEGTIYIPSGLNDKR